MPKMQFPVTKGKQTVFPSDHVCPWCRKRKLSDPPGMAVLNAGALHPVGKDSYEMAIDDAAFFTLVWHGDHSEPSKVDYDFATLDIADLVETGQFELYFCSTDCLRAFLNECVDELERRRQPKKRERNGNEARP